MVHLDTLPGDHHPASHILHVENELAATTADSVPAKHEVQTADFPSE
jgi:hypothetical protein